MVLGWFALCAAFFRTLRTRFPAKFDAIGSPSLILNNSIRNNWLSLRFLFSSELHALNDKRLSTLGRIMRAYFFAYLVWFLGPLAVAFARAA